MSPKREWSQSEKKRLAGAATILFVLAMVLFCWFAGRPLLRFASEPELFRAWVDAHGYWGQLSYLGMVAFQVFVAIIPGEPLEIAGGYAFGAAEGTILCLLGATIGSMLVFGLVRQFGLPLVEAFFPHKEIRSLRFLQLSPRRNLLFLLIFMTPGTPKDLMCYYAGLTDIRLSTWLLICSLGRIPSIITSTLGGNALGAENYWNAALVFMLALVISGIGLLIYRRLCRRLCRRQQWEEE